MEMRPHKKRHQQHTHRVDGDLPGERGTLLGGQRGSPVKENESNADRVNDADQPSEAKQNIRDQTCDHMRFPCRGAARGRTVGPPT
jgi:hypothetical protein